MTVIRIIIFVESTRVFQYKWDSWHPILVCTNISQFNFQRIDVNGWCKRLSKLTSTVCCFVITLLVYVSCQLSPPLVITQCWDVQMVICADLGPLMFRHSISEALVVVDIFVVTFVVFKRIIGFIWTIFLSWPIYGINVKQIKERQS